jgi:hypothetical protein
VRTIWPKSEIKRRPIETPSTLPDFTAPARSEGNGKGSNLTQSPLIVTRRLHRPMSQGSASREGEDVELHHGDVRRLYGCSSLTTTLATTLH